MTSLPFTILRGKQCECFNSHFTEDKSEVEGLTVGHTIKWQNEDLNSEVLTQ